MEDEYLKANFVQRNLIAVITSFFLLSGAAGGLFAWSMKLIDQTRDIAEKEALMAASSRNNRLLGDEYERLSAESQREVEKLKDLNEKKSIEIRDLKEALKSQDQLNKLIAAYIHDYGHLKVSENSCMENREAERRKALLTLDSIQAEAERLDNQFVIEGFVKRARGQITHVTICALDNS